MSFLRPLLIAAALLALLPASASAVSKRTLSIDVVTGVKDDTPCTIVADLHVPDGVSKANPAPAILATNGFGGSKAEFDALGPAYAKRGYVFLSYSGLGFGGSGCKITLDDRDTDGKAGSQLVSFLGGSKAAKDGTRIDYVQRDARDHDGRARSDDPRVGMIGGSYGGQIQFAIAAIDPRMDALVPQITWNDLSYSLAPNNTDFERGVTYATPGVTKLDWPTLFTGVGIAGITGATSDPNKVGPCPNFEDRVCQGLVQAGSRGYADPATLELLRHASVATFMERIRIPTLLAQGQSDNLFNLQESVATYRALRAQGTPVKLLWRDAGHSGGTLKKSENDQENPERAYESRMELEWFDFYLRGLGDPPRLDFSFVTDWLEFPKGGDAAPSVGSTPAYPAGTVERSFLSGDGKLVDSAGAAKAGSLRMAAVAGAPTSSGGGFLDPAEEDAPGTSIAWEGAALGSDLDVVGVPALTVKLDAPAHAGTQGADPASKLVLFAKLYDVDPSGEARLQRKLISAVRVGDVSKPVRLELPGIAHRFAKGHRLRLVLATSSVAYRGNNVAGPVGVTVDPAAPPVLELPRLGRQAGPAGSGPGGTTPFTAPASEAPAQKPGLGGPPAAPAAATLPSARRCASRRNFRIRLRRPRRGDSVRSARVTVNGKRVKVRRGKRRGGRFTAPIDLRGLPRGTVRVVVTVRTRKGRTLRSARTYRTCTPGPRR